LLRRGFRGDDPDMLGSGWAWDPRGFPNLTTQNNKKTSEERRRYNCIAWAAGTKTGCWWPDQAAIDRKLAFWPRGAPVDVTIEAFLLAFATRRYVECVDATFEPGFEKIAIFCIVHPNGDVEPTHATRQLRDGAWTSKMGRDVDIRHTILEAVS